MCLRCRKDVKFTSGLRNYVNSYKIPIILPSCPSSILVLILEYNTINHLDLLSNNFEENISPRSPNNSKRRIRPADIDNDKKKIKLADMDKQRPAIPN